MTTRNPSNDPLLAAKALHAPKRLSERRAWLARLEDDARAFATLRGACVEALATGHVVDLACRLVRELGADEAALAALGVPTHVLAFFPAWRAGSRRGFRPEPLGTHLVPLAANLPLGAVRLQLSSSSVTIPLGLSMLRDLARRLDRDVELVVGVDPDANLAAMERLARELAGRGADRVRFVRARSATVFAQDNARAVRDEHGRAALLLPRGLFIDDLRAGDVLDPRELEASFGVRAIASRLHWEGGNVLYDGAACLIGADTIAENVARLGLAAREVLRLFEAELGVAPRVLGRLEEARYDVARHAMSRSGQDSFHIDLDVALLGRWGRRDRPVALVADPARGLALLPAVRAKRALFRGHFVAPTRARELVSAEYEAFAAARFPRLRAYCDTLVSLGYEIVGMPDLRIDRREDVFGTANFTFGYCNVLPGLHRGAPAVHYLPWGIAALDAAATRRLARIGVAAVPVARDPSVSNGIMLFEGGLHCLCGALGVDRTV